MMISTKHLSFDKKTGKFTAEMSSLGPGFRFEATPYGQPGVTVESARTGVAYTFVIEFVKKDEEGDILFWYLRFANNASRLRYLRLQIFND